MIKPEKTDAIPIPNYLLTYIVPRIIYDIFRCICPCFFSFLAFHAPLVTEEKSGLMAKKEKSMRKMMDMIANLTFGIIILVE